VTQDVILAIDEGTSSARAIAYDETWTPVASAARRLVTDHPQPGWAEQDPEAILTAVVEVVAEVLGTIGGWSRVAAVGLANQGETVVAWDRVSGAALGPAVLWSCRRSQEIVDRIEAAGHGPEIRRRTGLPLDPYFSASKMRWLIEHVADVAAAAMDGRLALGTVDAWLTARLGGPPAGQTDASTASRTQLLALATAAWEEDLVRIWDVPASALGSVVPTVGSLGALAHPAWGGALPLRAMVCDQQAALAGQGGHRAGAIKATLGTGVFVLSNVGRDVPAPPPGILATIAWTDAAGRPTYALDGGVFSAGALLDWLRGDLGLVGEPAALDRLAGEVPDAGGMRILPALAGLGAPWWDPTARVVFAGMSAATGRAQVARAAIDAIAQRTADVVEAMKRDRPALARESGRASPSDSAPLRVDGGLSGSDLLVQRLADLIGRPVEIAARAESTALGTAILAAIGCGRIDEASAAAVVATKRVVDPAMDAATRLAERSAWTAFVRHAAAFEPAVPRAASAPATI
jgi:glycerol kinase